MSFKVEETGRQQPIQQSSSFVLSLTWCFYLLCFLTNTKKVFISMLGCDMKPMTTRVLTTVWRQLNFQLTNESELVAPGSRKKDWAQWHIFTLDLPFIPMLITYHPVWFKESGRENTENLSHTALITLWPDIVLK